MSRDLLTLEPSFRQSVYSLIEKCSLNGVKMTPYSTRRDVFEQARIWRRGRTSSEIRREILWLKENNADFLAKAIDVVGPQKGDKETYSIPGLSWHNWGQAVDCFWNVNGKSVWSGSGYEVYANIALEMGMDAGLYWKTITDGAHVQKSKYSSPIKTGMSICRVSAEMEKMYSRGKNNES